MGWPGRTAGSPRRRSTRPKSTRASCGRSSRPCAREPTWRPSGSGAEGKVASMSNEPLVGVQACVFDAYGTLFDFASAAKSCRDMLGDGVDRLTALWRDKQLQYTWLRALQGRHADFWQVTGDALDFAMETLSIDRSGTRERLMNLYLTLEVFPEAPDVLRQLKQAGLRTAILSNGSPQMLDAVVRAAGLEKLLDTVLSVEEVGVYKPHHKVYQLAGDRTCLPARAR